MSCSSLASLVEVDRVSTIQHETAAVGTNGGRALWPEDSDKVKPFLKLLAKTTRPRILDRADLGG
jgi:hypothetical protein